jgi:hypothetical protein
MKTNLFCFLFISAVAHASAQLKTTPLCPELVVNILDGKVNGIEPDFTQGQIKKALPCFTAEEPETAASACGGLIAYKDKDIYFYTGRDYIEIREKFKGKLSLPLMGTARSSLFKWLGYAKIKDVNWDAFETAYGILILHYNKAGKIYLIQFSKKSTDTLSLCE